MYSTSELDAVQDALRSLCYPCRRRSLALAIVQSGKGECPVGRSVEQSDRQNGVCSKLMSCIDTVRTFATIQSTFKGNHRLLG